SNGIWQSLKPLSSMSILMGGLGIKLAANDKVGVEFLTCAKLPPLSIGVKGRSDCLRPSKSCCCGSVASTQRPTAAARKNSLTCHSMFLSLAARRLDAAFSLSIANYQSALGIRLSTWTFGRARIGDSPPGFAENLTICDPRSLLSSWAGSVTNLRCLGRSL